MLIDFLCDLITDAPNEPCVGFPTWLSQPVAFDNTNVQFPVHLWIRQSHTWETVLVFPSTNWSWSEINLCAFWETPHLQALISAVSPLTARFLQLWRRLFDYHIEHQMKLPSLEAVHTENSRYLCWTHAEGWYCINLWGRHGTLP